MYNQGIEMLTPNVALDSLSDLQEFVNKITGCCGMDILSSSFRINWHVRFCIFAIVSYTTCNMYTLYYFSGDLSRQLQTVCINGLLFTVKLKNNGLFYTLRLNKFLFSRAFINSVPAFVATPKYSNLTTSCD